MCFLDPVKQALDPVKQALMICGIDLEKENEGDDDILDLSPQKQSCHDERVWEELIQSDEAYKDLDDGGAIHRQDKLYAHIDKMIAHDREVELKALKLAKEERIRVEREEREKARCERIMKEVKYRELLKEKLEKNKKWAGEEDSEYRKRKANEVQENPNMKTVKKCKVSDIMCSMNSVGGVGFGYTK